MQLFEMQGLLAGKCLPGDMLVGESLSQYFLRQFNQRDELAAKLEIVNGLMDAATELNNLAKENVIALQAKCDALAAENVALKDVVGLTVNNLYASGYEAKQNSMHPWESLIFEGEKVMSTPATYAAIAEIKLKTIRELVSKVSEDLKQKGQSARRIANLDFTWAYIETARAEMHNANLRAGRKG